MQVSPKGVAQIAAEEGIVTRAYKSPAGDWTIGVGHSERSGLTPVPHVGMTITRDEALSILARDLAGTFEPRTTKAMPGAAQTAFDGGGSFDFNTGKIDSASWVARWRKGDMAGAETALGWWNKVGQKVVQGLVNRRHREANLIFRGRYSDAALALLDGTFKPEIAPSVASQTGQEAEYLGKLKTLGFDGDGAVLRYQEQHPDLVDDGILGPATRAQIDRDISAKETAPSPPVKPAEPWWLIIVNLILSLFKRKA